MPTRRERAPLLVDTSVAVALMVADHEHRGSRRQPEGRRLGLAGQVAFETFSALTRLPPPARRAPAVIGTLSQRNFPATVFLSAEGATALFARLASADVAGGSIYDALVGAAAVDHCLPLASRDRGALAPYLAIGVEVDLLA